MGQGNEFHKQFCGPGLKGICSSRLSWRKAETGDGLRRRKAQDRGRRKVRRDLGRELMARKETGGGNYALQGRAPSVGSPWPGKGSLQLHSVL
jgi:hypothetical protein